MPTSTFRLGFTPGDAHIPDLSLPHDWPAKLAGLFSFSNSNSRELKLW